MGCHDLVLYQNIHSAQITDAMTWARAKVSANLQTAHGRTRARPLLHMMLYQPSSVVIVRHRLADSPPWPSTEPAVYLERLLVYNSKAPRQPVSLCDDATLVIMQQVFDLHTSDGPCRPTTLCGGP